MSAACAGHLDVVDYLLTRGVEWKTLCDKSGRTAVDLARASGHLHVAEWIEAKGTVSGSSDYLYKNASGNQDQLRIHPRTSPGPFHCATCGILLRDTARQDHCHSTLHQFNCQHRPIVHRYGIPQSNKGYMLLLGNGWDPEKGLGSVAEGKQFPVKTVLKRDRLGLGAEGRGGERLKARITHFGPGDTSAVERPQRRRLKHESCDGVNLPKKRKRAVELAKERKWEMELRRHFNSEWFYSTIMLLYVYTRVCIELYLYCALFMWSFIPMNIIIALALRKVPFVNDCFEFSVCGSRKIYRRLLNLPSWRTCTRLTAMFFKVDRVLWKIERGLLWTTSPFPWPRGPQETRE